MIFQTIDCTQLDFDDTTYLMSYPLKAPRVIASVGTIGVLQPVIVSGCACHGKYQIISGFRRAHACKEIGLPVIQANIHPIDPDARLSAFLMALYENLAHRQFNDVEKSLILHKLLHEFECPRDEILQGYMPALQLAPNEKVLDIYLKLARFGEELKQYLAEHDMPLTILEIFTTLSDADRGAVFSLISEVRLGLNKLKELLSDLEEIALRDGCSLAQILDDENIQHVLDDEKLPGPQKIEQIRQFIRKTRYPHLTQLEHEYQNSLKALHLSPGIQFRTDRSFEDDRLTATFRFSTPEQLKTHAEELLYLSEQAELQKVLGIIQGNSGA
jgi:hypothetical protein